jgi:hypothetical protein
VRKKTVLIQVAITLAAAASCASPMSPADTAHAKSDVAATPLPSLSPGLPDVPAAFASACGHPGAQVVITAVPLTISHAQCDLTGVVVSYGTAGVTIPATGGVGAAADGVTVSTTLIAEVDPTTRDVTITGEIGTAPLSTSASSTT